MDKKKEVPVPAEKSKTNTLMHDFSESGSNSSLFSMKLIILLIVVILLGAGTGYYFAGSPTNTISGDELKSASEVEKGETYGASNTKAYKDSAEGVLKEGGLDGEGQYHLERPGGVSQNVYVTSSSVDLSLFLNKKIRIRGQTFDAQKAGWLMDVGQVEVL